MTSDEMREREELVKRLVGYPRDRYSVFSKDIRRAAELLRAPVGQWRPIESAANGDAATIREALEQQGERIEGIAFRDGDCFARERAGDHPDGPGDCIEPSWIFVENAEYDPEAPEERRAILLFPNSEEDGG